MIRIKYLGTDVEDHNVNGDETGHDASDNHIEVEDTVDDGNREWRCYD